MAKYTLAKLFHIDPMEHEMEYEKRFNSSDAVKLDIFIGDNQAFFCPDTEIYKLALSIERTDKKINELYNILPPKAIEHFTKRCLIDEIVISNNIEGVHSTRKEISDILEDLSRNNKRNRFAGLVNKYAMLMHSDEIPLGACEDIRRIYDDIFYDEIKNSDPANLPDGKIFRKNSVSVYSPSDKVIHNGLFPESAIIETMKKALKHLNNDNIEPLFKIAVFHYLFGYIHPFYDGNGRMSRFISSYLLAREFNHLISYRISYTIKENISIYYDAFKVCNHPNNKGDLTPFLKMFLTIVEKSELQLCEALEKRVSRLEFYSKAVSVLPHSDDKLINDLYFILIQATLFSDSGIGLAELQNHLDVSYNTLNNKLKLLPEEFLVITKDGHYKLFSLNLDVVDKAISTNI